MYDIETIKSSMLSLKTTFRFNANGGKKAIQIVKKSKSALRLKRPIG